MIQYSMVDHAPYLHVLVAYLQQLHVARQLGPDLRVVPLTGRQGQGSAPPII